MTKENSFGNEINPNMPLFNVTLGVPAHFSDDDISSFEALFLNEHLKLTAVSRREPMLMSMGYENLNPTPSAFQVQPDVIQIFTETTSTLLAVGLAKGLGYITGRVRHAGETLNSNKKDKTPIQHTVALNESISLTYTLTFEDTKKDEQTLKEVNKLVESIAKKESVGLFVDELSRLEG